MTVSKRRPLKLKGAVLIMVITILFVFILMLLATLAVVSSTTRRTYTKYEENQAYYTARSVLEVYMAEYLEDKTPYENSSNVTNVIKAMEAQGIKLEETDDAGKTVTGADVFINAGYDSTSGSFDVDNAKSWQYVDFADKFITNGFVHQQELFGYLKPKYKFVKDIKTVKNHIDDENWELDKSNNDYYLEFEAEIPSTSATDGGKFDYDNKVIVRVELLRVLYFMKDGTVNDTTNRTSGSINVSEIDWDKTYYRLKVATTANLGDGSPTEIDIEGDKYNVPENNSEITVSVILEPNLTISRSGFTNAMTSMEGTLVPDKASVIGGGSATASKLGLTNDSVFSGGFVYETKELVVSTQDMDFYLPSNKSFVVQGGCLRLQNGHVIEGEGDLSVTGEDLSKRPFIYAAGLYTNNATSIGCDFDTKSFSDSACDVVLTAEDGGMLYKNNLTPDTNIITASGYKPEKVAGYITGSRFIVNGDMYIDGDFIVDCGALNSGDFAVDGNVYCTGTIYFSDAAKAANFTFGEVYANAVTDYAGNAITLSAADSVNAAESFDAKLASGEVNPETKEVKIFLPEKGRGELVVPTKDSVVTEYVDDKNITIPAEEKIKQDISPDMTLDISSSAKEVMGKAHTVQTITYNEDTLSNVMVIDPETVGYYNTTTDMCEMIFDPYNFFDQGLKDGDVIYIDTRKKKAHIQLRGQSSNAPYLKFVFIGDCGAVITVPGGETVNFEKSGFYSYEIYKMLENGDTFYIGEDTDAKNKNNPPAPKISYYIGKDATFMSTNAAENVVYCGYMYGPEAKIQTASGMGPKFNYSYNNGKERNSKINIGFFGSVVFRDIDIGNYTGAFYIDPNSGGSSGGAGSTVIWGRTRYLNTQ